MKLNKLITTAAFALAVAALMQTSASAQTFSTGDLILGFQTSSGTGATSNLEVDLGAYTNFTSIAGTGDVLQLNVGGALGTGGLSLTDLTSTYGNSWSTNSNLTWDVAGTKGTATKESFLTVIGGSPAATENSTGNGASFVNGEYNNGAGTASANSTTASILPNNSAGSFTYQVTNNGGFASGNDFGVGYNTQTGVTGANNQLDLYDLKNHSGSTTPGTLLGTFDLTSAGVLDFTATGQAVPEPSAYALGICAMLLFLVLKRRSTIKA